MIIRRFLILLTIAMCCAAATLAQLTEFTFQGKLNDGGSAVATPRDLRFRLWNADSGGSQVGADLVSPSVPFNAGVFTVQLDFGELAFTGAGRWIEIAVSLPGANDYTTLAPRQKLTAAPYAVRSAAAASSESVDCALCITDAHIISMDGGKVSGQVASAANSASLGGLPASRFVQSDTNGNVGIGAVPGTGSKLTVGGQIETTSGGIKFPNGTTQSTAGLTSVTTGTRLTGSGTALSPLDIASPLDVRAADNPARQPFSASINNTGVVFTNVAGSGVTLVIENLSGFVAASAQSGGLLVTLGIGNDSFIRSYNIGPSLIYQIPDSNAVAYYNHRVRLYVSQGQRLEVTFPANLNRAMQFSGYYVSVP